MVRIWCIGELGRACEMTRQCEQRHEDGDVCAAHGVREPGWSCRFGRRN